MTPTNSPAAVRGRRNRRGYSESVRNRFEAKVDRSGNCHRWTASLNHKGYGEFWLDGKLRRAHVVALLLVGVEVPRGLTVDHVWARGCKFRDCVRVDHLEVVTSEVNNLRGDSPTAINARKTHCKNGHEFSTENTRIDGKGGRHCRICNRLPFARSRAKEAPAC